MYHLFLLKATQPTTASAAASTGPSIPSFDPGSPHATASSADVKICLLVLQADIYRIVVAINN